MSCRLSKPGFPRFIQPVRPTARLTSWAPQKLRQVPLHMGDGGPRGPVAQIAMMEATREPNAPDHTWNTTIGNSSDWMSCTHMGKSRNSRGRVAPRDPTKTHTNHQSNSKSLSVSTIFLLECYHHYSFFFFV